jgi:hypothetical protein
MSAAAASLFNFDLVVANFQGFIDSLFALVIAPQPVFSGGAPATMGSRLVRPSGGFGRPIGAGIHNYFPSDIRNTIIGAGRSRMLVQLSYDGYDRLIEPYSLSTTCERRMDVAWNTSGDGIRPAGRVARSASSSSYATKFNQCAPRCEYFSRGSRSNSRMKHDEQSTEPSGKQSLLVNCRKSKLVYRFAIQTIGAARELRT